MYLAFEFAAIAMLISAVLELLAPAAAIVPAARRVVPGSKFLIAAPACLPPGLPDTLQLQMICKRA
jgi:hypothetical protein